jgi:carbamoyl-phosphate synthase large subunit
MAARIHIGGAGGAPSNGFIKSLRISGRKDYLIGTSSVPSDLFLADVDERYCVPPATSPDYPDKILTLIKKVHPDLIHVQNDYEVIALSRLRRNLLDLGVKFYLPEHDTIEKCKDKYLSHVLWHKAGIRVPRTIPLHCEEDLKRSFSELGGKIWIRAKSGAAGRGALPTGNYEFARLWIDHFEGWGIFTAAEMLTQRTVTWLSIWYKGELVVAQTRRRRSWSFGDRTLSGVTGITGVGETCSDPVIDKIAIDSIHAIDPKPHGIFGVDMAYDQSDVPNPTEINVGRFFTTHLFFSKAGLNLPEIYCTIALDGKLPDLPRKINPLPNGLVWIRGMDTEPVLTTREELEKLEQCMI